MVSQIKPANGRNVRYKLVVISGTKERVPEKENYEFVTSSKKDLCVGLSYQSRRNKLLAEPQYNDVPS